MTPEQTAELIDKAGGTSAFGRELGFDKTDSSGWRQRVHNWRLRGLPYRVLVEHNEAIGRIQRYRKPR